MQLEEEESEGGYLHHVESPYHEQRSGNRDMFSIYGQIIPLKSGPSLMTPVCDQDS